MPLSEESEMWTVQEQPGLSSFPLLPIVSGFVNLHTLPS
jgi:hypothetical protein